MHRVIAIKELRETALLWGFALVVFAYGVLSIVAPPFETFKDTFLSDWVPGGLLEVTRNQALLFIDSWFYSWFGCVMFLFTLAMGLWQSFGDSVRGTYLFLLHRPMARWRIIGLKLLVGVGACLALGAATIVTLGIWAATPGTHPGPFEWSMTAGFWRLLLGAPLVYFGAFLTGIRPARWFGSRLLPLATGAFLFFLAASIPFYPVWWMVVVAVEVACYALFIASILSAAGERDYS